MYLAKISSKQCPTTLNGKLIIFVVSINYMVNRTYSFADLFGEDANILRGLEV